MIVTKKYQRRKKCKDGKIRNFVHYFLEDQKILTLKDPFEKNWDKGYDLHTVFSNEYIEGNKLFITKTKFGKVRNISYPIKKLYEIY